MTINASIAPKLTLRWITLAGALVLVTLATFVLALYAHQVSEFPPLSLANMINSEFGAYEVGIVFQELLIPLALIYFLSNTGPFRRSVSGEAVPGDMFKIFGMLTIVQILSLNYTLLTDELTTFGVLVVMGGGLLGNWRVGLGLGLVTMLIIGTQEFIFYPDEDFLLAYQHKGLAGIFDLALLSDIFFWYYLTDLGASSAIWAGLVSGFCTDLLGERRFAPLTALGLGIGISLGVIFFTAISWGNPAFMTPFLIPGVAVSGLAMTAIALIVRNVQADIVRRKAEAAELARIQAELRALRAQINPHFLFNALNTIRYFVRTDPEIARRLLINLSEVFQQALRSGEFVPLRDELSYVEAYLALEKARLDERLQITWSVQAETWLDHPVPTLILQPVVENAIIHGIAKKPKGGRVIITIEPLDNHLLLQVEDNGLGIDPARLAEILSPEQTNNTAIGLRNINGRLQTLYGEAHRLVIESEIERGTCVQIKIPRRA